eukprot:1338946-Alexandrium_andersonii.AAC.1
MHPGNCARTWGCMSAHPPELHTTPRHTMPCCYATDKRAHTRKQASKQARTQALAYASTQARTHDSTQARTHVSTEA